MFCIFPLFLYHVLSKKLRRRDYVISSFQMFFGLLEISGHVSNSENSTEHHTNTSMDGKTRVSKRAPQSQPFLGNASSFLKSFYKNPVRWYVYVHFLIFVFFYSQYIFCQSACGRRKHDEKKNKKTQIKKRNQSQLDCSRAAT